MSIARRLKLFQIGAKAISRYTGDDTFYYCPICAGRFVVEDARSGRLTLEDVPPKSVGGKPLLLTCKNCNNTAGHAVDVHLARYDELMDFTKQIVRSEVGETPSVILEIDGHQVRIVLRQDGDLLRMEIIHQISNPKDLDAFYQHLNLLSKEGRWDGTQMHLRKSIPLKERLRKLAHLKTAFLLLTAELGYKYAFDERLEPVRKQLLQPDKDIIGTRFWFTLDHVQDLERAIAFIDQAEPFILVINGRDGVIMPHLSSPIPFYDWIGQNWEQGARIHVTGTAIEWPEEMLMWLDSR